MTLAIILAVLGICGIGAYVILRLLAVGRVAGEDKVRAAVNAKTALTAVAMAEARAYAARGIEAISKKLRRHGF